MVGARATAAGEIAPVPPAFRVVLDWETGNLVVWNLSDEQRITKAVDSCGTIWGLLRIWGACEGGSRHYRGL